jgi:hypothetical protein
MGHARSPAGRSGTAHNGRQRAYPDGATVLRGKAKSPLSGRNNFAWEPPDRRGRSAPRTMTATDPSPPVAAPPGTCATTRDVSVALRNLVLDTVGA